MVLLLQVATKYQSVSSQLSISYQAGRRLLLQMVQQAGTRIVIALVRTVDSREVGPHGFESRHIAYFIVYRHEAHGQRYLEHGR